MGLLALLIIAAIGIFLFAPRKLPELGASFGNVVREFKRGMHREDKERPGPQSKQEKN